MSIREAVPSDAKSIARVHVETWQTAYAGIMPSEFLASLSYQNREVWWANALEATQSGMSYFVAEVEEKGIVGFAGAGPEREADPTYLAELYMIYVLQPHHRMGLGRGLALAVARSMRLAERNSMLVWVLQDNRTGCRFYEALGGTRIKEKTIEIGGTNLIEVAYGWKDLTDLIAACGTATP